MLPIFAATGGHGLSVAGPDEEDRAGSLSDWVLLLHTTDNETLTFHVDMTAHVTCVPTTPLAQVGGGAALTLRSSPGPAPHRALPIRGNLTTTPVRCDPSPPTSSSAPPRQSGCLALPQDSLARSSPHLPDASVEGVTVSVQPGLERYEGPCYGGCRPEVGDIGVGLSTNPHGDGAAFNRIVGARSVVFKPPRAFLGDDHFMYTVSIPPLTSAPARVDVAVRQCRLGWCGDELV